MQIDIYTDGACAGNPGQGGWGAVLIRDGESKEIYGGEPRTTTNNRMELTAAIKALEALKDPCEVRLYTDSTYVCNGAKQLMGTRLSDTPFTNSDLWVRLQIASKQHRIDWKWVRGHSGNAGNERADALACKGLNEMIAAEGKESVDICIDVDVDSLEGTDYYRWSGLLSRDGSVKKLHAEKPNTTSNRMYISAAIEMLETLENPCGVVVYADSDYLCNGASKWIEGWMKNGWRKSDGNPVKNKDLWVKLYEVSKKHKVRWMREAKSNIMERIAQDS